MNILVIGDSCVDKFIYGDIERICPEAPVPVLQPRYSTQNPGMASNVVKNLESLGVIADLITNKEQILKIRYIDDKSGQMVMRLDENDRCERILIDVQNIFHKYDAIIISDYNKGFLHTDDIEEYIQLAQCPIFLDSKKILGEWCNEFRFIKINNREYESTKRTLTKNLKEKLIITRGPYGSEHEGELFPVSSVEVKDTSGAGDTFLAALVKKYVETKDIKQSIVFANECATLVVQKRGVSAL